VPLFCDCVVLQLDLSNNQLCGLDQFGRGNYTAEGITAIADALRVSASLTFLKLGRNLIGDEGTTAIARALKDSKVSKLASLDLNSEDTSNKIGPTGAKELAAYLAVSASLTILK
jgi:Ran GTPase-activating protein (RanGAP) involved in mRNA processing and transport